MRYLEAYFNADTHAPQGGKADGGEPQTLLGRLRRVVLPVKRDCSVDNPNSPGDYTLPARMKSSTGLALHFMRKGLPRRSWACPVALRGVLKGEGASATTAPKCTQVRVNSVNSARPKIAKVLGRWFPPFRPWRGRLRGLPATF